jgi:hypothetical protein
MTSFFLFLSDVFVWSYGFFEVFGNVVNWLLFFGSCILFVYWCWMLYVKLGNNKDKDYTSPSKEIRPYYDPEIYKKG